MKLNISNSAVQFGAEVSTGHLFLMSFDDMIGSAHAESVLSI
jgi:hypothetical protein